MKHLKRIRASPEQLRIFSANQLGAELIRGAAGSGKTTTAILRLASLANLMRARKDRVDDESPVRALLLTFNRTLAGYISALIEAQVMGKGHEIEIYTFAEWAMSELRIGSVQADAARAALCGLARKFAGLDSRYLMGEVEYLLGRFKPNELENYVTRERTGRGTSPRVDADLRRRILNEVVYPYCQHLDSNKWIDWNRLAIKMNHDIACLGYDIIAVDESQDFSANQIRAINHHLAHDHAAIFVTDTVQRIYARGFTWIEAGISIAANRSHLLRENYRNTKEIAAFARGILNGISVDADGVLPDLNAATSSGPRPKVVIGRYSKQVSWAINFICHNVELTQETAAFLKPQGGGWFNAIKSELSKFDIKYVDMQRKRDWPQGSENVALSTFHSAKGLEFDYVFVLGFNQQNTPFDSENLTDQILVLRRLLAVAIARARK